MKWRISSFLPSSLAPDKRDFWGFHAWNLKKNAGDGGRVLGRGAFDNQLCGQERCCGVSSSSRACGHHLTRILRWLLPLHLNISPTHRLSAHLKAALLVHRCSRTPHASPREDVSFMQSQARSHPCLFPAPLLLYPPHV